MKYSMEIVTKARDTVARLNNPRTRYQVVSRLETEEINRLKARYSYIKRKEHLHKIISKYKPNMEQDSRSAWSASSTSMFDKSVDYYKEGNEDRKPVLDEEGCEVEMGDYGYKIPPTSNYWYLNDGRNMAQKILYYRSMASRDPPQKREKEDFDEEEMVVGGVDIQEERVWEEKEEEKVEENNQMEEEPEKEPDEKKEEEKQEPKEKPKEEPKNEMKEEQEKEEEEDEDFEEIEKVEKEKEEEETNENDESKENEKIEEPPIEENKEEKQRRQRKQRVKADMRKIEKNEIISKMDKKIERDLKKLRGEGGDDDNDDDLEDDALNEVLKGSVGKEIDEFLKVV